jgi:hypothetical protein
MQINTQNQFISLFKKDQKPQTIQKEKNFKSNA